MILNIIAILCFVVSIGFSIYAITIGQLIAINAIVMIFSIFMLAFNVKMMIDTIKEMKRD